MRGNVVQFNSLPNPIPKPKGTLADDTDNQPTRKKRGLLTRFLLNIKVMKTKKYGNDSNEVDEWNAGTLFIITLLFALIIGGFICILILGGIAYNDIKEDWRGTETWRSKQIYDNMLDNQKKCEASVLRQKGLIKYAEQSNVKLPPEFLLVESCGQAEINKGNTGH